MVKIGGRGAYSIRIDERAKSRIPAMMDAQIASVAMMSAMVAGGGPTRPSASSA